MYKRTLNVEPRCIFLNTLGPNDHEWDQCFDPHSLPYWLSLQLRINTTQSLETWWWPRKCLEPIRYGKCEGLAYTVHTAKAVLYSRPEK